MPTVLAGGDYVALFVLAAATAGTVTAGLTRLLREHRRAAEARLEGKLDALLRHAALPEGERLVIAELERQHAG